MITTPVNLDVMTARDRNNLSLLRGRRNAAAEELIGCITWHMDYEKAQGLLDQIMTYQDAGLAYTRIKQNLIAHETYGVIPDLKAFRDLCFRIARLEREACGLELERELATA